MTSNISAGRLAGKWVVAGLATAMALAPGGGTLQASTAENWHAIEGVWLVQVQLRICATGAPLGAPFSSVVTFHEGGTVREGTTATRRSHRGSDPAPGPWEHPRARRLQPEDECRRSRSSTDPNPPASPGFLQGWQVVEQTASSPTTTTSRRPAPTRSTAPTAPCIGRAVSTRPRARVSSRRSGMGAGASPRRPEYETTRRAPPAWDRARSRAPARPSDRMERHLVAHVGRHVVEIRRVALRQDHLGQPGARAPPAPSASGRRSAARGPAA